MMSAEGSKQETAQKRVPPEFPVPVVRMIVPDTAGRVLVVQRGDTRYSLGGWCLPGGKVDYGMTVEECVNKELQEEVGLSCMVARFLFYQDSLPLEAHTMHCINLYFECAASGLMSLNREVLAYSWINELDLGQYNLVFRNDLGLLRYWRDRKGVD